MVEQKAETNYNSLIDCDPFGERTFQQMYEIDDCLDLYQQDECKESSVATHSHSTNTQMIENVNFLIAE